jgi:hypothetical protein
MAARKNIYKPADVERIRAKIANARAQDTLAKVINGELEVSTARMKAIEIALRKTIPDLSSVELAGDLGANVVFTWADEKSRKSKG